MARRAARAARRLLATVAVLLIAALALIRIPLWVTRIHMQHLLADFHSLEANRSTWADAQRLMHRWGRWGHYDGACTAADCVYTIRIENDSSTKDRELFGHLQALGAKYAGYVGSFTVHDGRVVRTSGGFRLSVPPRTMRQEDEYGYGLMLGSQVRSQLSTNVRANGGHWILGDDDQLDAHPEYKVGRPDGCEICMAGELTYTPALPHAEVISLTDYDFSCLTRWHPCTELFDLLPAARAWHLYDEGTLLHDQALDPPTTCRTPAYALGRDAGRIMQADVLSTTAKLETIGSGPDTYVQTSARFRLTALLRGDFDHLPGEEFTEMLFPGDIDDPWSTRELPVSVTAGEHVMLAYRYEGMPLRLGRCGVIPDTPANRAEVLRGMTLGEPIAHEFDR